MVGQVVPVGGAQVTGNGWLFDVRSVKEEPQISSHSVDCLTDMTQIHLSLSYSMAKWNPPWLTAHVPFLMMMYHMYHMMKFRPLCVDTDYTFIVWLLKFEHCDLFYTHIFSNAPGSVVATYVEIRLFKPYWKQSELSVLQGRGLVESWGSDKQWLYCNQICDLHNILLYVTLTFMRDYSTLIKHPLVVACCVPCGLYILITAHPSVWSFCYTCYIRMTRCDLSSQLHPPPPCTRVGVSVEGGVHALGAWTGCREGI